MTHAEKFIELIRMATPTVSIFDDKVGLIFTTRNDAEVAYNLLWQAIDEPAPAPLTQAERWEIEDAKGNTP